MRKNHHRVVWKADFRHPHYLFKWNSPLLVLGYEDDAVVSSFKEGLSNLRKSVLHDMKEGYHVMKKGAHEVKEGTKKLARKADKFFDKCDDCE